MKKLTPLFFLRYSMTFKLHLVFNDDDSRALNDRIARDIMVK
ncbi:MAG: hypothetical protein SPJ62_02280 [Inconstantimicrobium porci]|nr:hypothetical protein [Inconstantimicrobium porci]MDY5910842.1 hypothetical protein [Inconstantimicrobium porci]